MIQKVTDFPQFTYDPLEDMLVIPMAENDYIKARDANFVEFYTQLRFFYIFGMTDRKCCFEILSQIVSDNFIDTNNTIDMHIAYRITARLITHKYIESMGNEKNLLNEANKFCTMDAHNILIDNILLTDKGKALFDRLKYHEDNNIPDINTNPFLFEEMVSKKLRKLLNAAESNLQQEMP